MIDDHEKEEVFKALNELQDVLYMYGIISNKDFKVFQQDVVDFPGRTTQTYSSWVDPNISTLEKYDDLQMGMDIGTYLYNVRMNREEDR